MVLTGQIFPHPNHPTLFRLPGFFVQRARPIRLRTTLEREIGMVYQLLFLATVSPGRQLGLRKAVIAHVLILLGCLWAVRASPADGAILLGHVLLTIGICEGAILLGWRLTQFPKNLGLEFLLVSPEPPWRLFAAEAL